MKKEDKKMLTGVIVTLLVLGAVGMFTGIIDFGGKEATTQPPQQPIYQQPVVQQPGLIYVDLSGNLMDKGKFMVDTSNSYAGIATQPVKFFDITKNPQNDPRTNLLAVPDFQIVSSSETNGLLEGTKRGIAGHTYVYLYENTTGAYYDVTGSFTVPANINPYAPSYDFGNVLVSRVGTVTTYNETGLRTDTGVHTNITALASTTKSTDLRIQVGSETYANFVRIWGEYDASATKNAIIGISAIQKSGPSTGVVIDSSDNKNPIITINELTAQYPLTFTYYIQGSSDVPQGQYKIYVDDWNAVPGKFMSKVTVPVGFVASS